MYNPSLFNFQQTIYNAVYATTLTIIACDSIPFSFIIWERTFFQTNSPFYYIILVNSNFILYTPILCININ